MAAWGHPKPEKLSIRRPQKSLTITAAYKAHRIIVEPVWGHLAPEGLSTRRPTPRGAPTVIQTILGRRKFDLVTDDAVSSFIRECLIRE